MPIVQEKFETCGLKTAAGLFDMKKLTFEMLDDTTVAINGSIKTTKLITSPWQVEN